MSRLGILLKYLITLLEVCSSWMGCRYEQLVIIRAPETARSHRKCFGKMNLKNNFSTRRVKPHDLPTTPAMEIRKG
jgi:hypothetical protein